MRRSRLLAALAASVVLSIVVGLYAPAQNRTTPAAPAASAPAPAQGQPVALIDISRVLKNYNRQQIEETRLKNDMARAEEGVKAERQTLQNWLEELHGLKPGTQAYNQKEAQIAQHNAVVTTQIKLQQKEFAERGANMSLLSYREIQAEIRAYAGKYGIAMVQRFSTDATKPVQPQAVAQTLFRQVVWYDASLDITDVVISWLNQRNPGPRPGQPGPPPTANVPFGQGTRR